MNPKVTIGNKIKFVRELRGYKQEYMATQLGISQNGYSKIEADKVDMLLSRLDNIAEILEMDTKDLMNVDIDKTIDTVLNIASDSISQNNTPPINNEAVDTKMLLERIFLLEERMRKLEE